MRSFRYPSKLALLVTLVVVGACTEFESIDRDECGNGILEFGEDCDSSDARCVSCSVTCDAVTDCASYGAGMEGFVCGADSLCHAPGGAFRAAVEHTFPVDSFRVTDIDGDGIGDILAQSSTSIDVLYGRSDGAPTTRVSQQSPIARGPACYGHLDVGTSLDVVLPTSDGLVTYTSTFGSPAPLPFASPLDPNMGEPQFVNGLSDDILVVIATRQDALRLAVLDVRTEPQTLLLETDLCNALPAELDPQQIDVAETPTGFVIAARLETMPARICAIRVERGVPNWTSTTISPAVVPVSRPLLFSLNGGCPSLYVTNPNHLVEFMPTAPPCAFGTRRDFLATDAGAFPLAAFPFEQVDGVTTVGLVLLGGVFHVDNGMLQPLYPHDRFVTDVAATDLDNDGLTDLVASSAGAEDLDIYYRIAAGPAAFRRYRYSTDGAVRRFVFGDFDGNQRVDIAYVQAGGVSNSEQLAIAYGTSDLFLPGAIVGSFGTVRALLRTDFPDSNDPTGGVVDDLILLFSDADNGQVATTDVQVALLHGSPQRTMLSFFSPNIGDGGRFRGAVAGHFLDTVISDLLAFEEIVDADGFTRVRMWQTSALTLGDRIPYTYAPQLGDCDTQKEVDFCVDGARYVPWPEPSNELDVVIGVDRLGRALAIDPRQLNIDPNADNVTMTGQLWSAGLLGDSEGPVRSMHAITIDGEARLLVSRDFGVGAGSVSLCTVDGSGVASECADLATAIATASGIENIYCDDATPARVAPTARFSPPPSSSELLALCHTVDIMDPNGETEPSAGLHGLFRVTLGETIGAEPLMFLQGGEQVRVGDVNGDAVDDIVVVDRSTGVPTVQIHVQCTSRDLDCVGQGVGPIVDEPAGGAR